MTLQNRVTPLGEIVAAPWRGTLMGNRGHLHGPDRRLGTPRWRTRAWVTCVTEFRGRHRDPMPPRRYTALFFTDEVAALAAGHRPCGECRRADYVRFRDAWRATFPDDASLDARDRRLHAARVGRDRQQVRVPYRLGDLPDGAFVAIEGRPHLLWAGGLHPWSDGRYGEPVPTDPDVVVALLTPTPTVAVLAAGYRPCTIISIL